MSKATNFIITVQSQAEFDQAWASLVAAGYNTSPHKGSEHNYKGAGSVIKHSNGLGYIWSTQDTTNHGKTHYNSFGQFEYANPVVFPKPTMNDAIALVALDEEVNVLQAELYNRREAVVEAERTIENKMRELRALQVKLNIVA